jgi:hypothetical protein
MSVTQFRASAWAVIAICCDLLSLLLLTRNEANPVAASDNKARLTMSSANVNPPSLRPFISTSAW